MRFTTIIIATATAVAGIAQPAAAEDGGLRVSVSYADLDLTREADARIMVDRLTDAAEEACGGDPHYQNTHRLARLQARRQFRACVSGALSGAVAALDAPQVQRAYAATTARPVG